MKNQLYALLILITVVSFTSCDKDKDDPPAKTKTELLATGSWKFSSATVSGFDVAGFIQACQKDNILTFQANGSGTVDEGVSKCNTNDPQTNSFTWNFTSNESILHVSAVFFTGGSNDYNVISITETQLVGSQMVDFGGGPQNVVVTFVH
jgi:hypothetical protein